MASLIVHGDLNHGGPALGRPLYAHPILTLQHGNEEATDSDRLLVDVIYEAVIRIREGENGVGVAPSVFLINLSVGDQRRPFTGAVSPLARLLDFLSEKYGVLFLVSAGNIGAPITINRYSKWTDLQGANDEERERAVLEAVNSLKAERSILSPGEAINVITVGAQHCDDVDSQRGLGQQIDPYRNQGLPNASSALGLGFRRSVKPEILLPAGREQLRMLRTGGREGVEAAIADPQRVFGVRAATPGSSGRGTLDSTSLQSGTSSATALATRAAHRIFDSLTDPDSGGMFAAMTSDHFAVVVKTLLVHRSRWDVEAEQLLRQICGPDDTARHVEQSENIIRFLGYGVPNLHEAMECASNRATLVGYGTLKVNEAHNYRVPLPLSLERVTDPRSLTMTLAWLSPVKPTRRNYRGLRLEAMAVDPKVALGVERLRKARPSDKPVKRGTVLHNRYVGSKAVSFIDDGHLSAKVWCRSDAGSVDQSARYGFAVTIETEAPIGIYEEIRERLRVEAPRP